MYFRGSWLFLFGKEVCLYCTRFQCYTKLVYIYSSDHAAVCPRHTEPRSYLGEIVVKNVH